MHLNYFIYRHVCLISSHVVSSYITHISCKGLDVMSLAAETSGTWNWSCFLLTLLQRLLGRSVSHSELMQQHLHIRLVFKHLLSVPVPISFGTYLQPHLPILPMCKEHAARSSRPAIASFGEQGQRICKPQHTEEYKNRAFICGVFRLSYRGTNPVGSFESSAGQSPSSCKDPMWP